MRFVALLGLLLQATSYVAAYQFDSRFDDWNLNKNQFAIAPTEYWGEWDGHQYTPSPDNWRFPFYTVMPDRFVNGDPHNDNINGTLFERDTSSTQLRYGGDVAGIVDSLDYIHGMGIRGIYVAGSFFINSAWTYDQYSPIDLTLLDQHLGTLQQWQALIDAIHARGMYVILDNTFATLGDLIGFENHLNESVPFSAAEYPAQYKTARQYNDFNFGNTYNNTCDFPKFWNETGFPVDASVSQQFHGCYDSEFDQFGDTEAFGVYPDWRREVTKFASVQDRLREWYPPVREKLQNFYCMAIAQLDVDGFRFDKATQSTVDALGSMNSFMRECAARYGKKNFFLPGEITGGNSFGAVYVGRGRQPDMLPDTITDAMYASSNGSSALDQYSIRPSGQQALDSAAFHYTAYRALVRFLGMDGTLEAAFDAPTNWVDMWNTFLVSNDFTNPSTGAFDPRHMYGVTNQDVFRWPAIANGTQRQLLGHFITTLLLPGIPLVLWGEEQEFYVLDNTAANYVFGRQPMSSSIAWQHHGCYSLESVQFYKWPLDKARHGCTDDTVSYDHRDPSAPVRNSLKHMYSLRNIYPVLNDGLFLQQLSNMTFQVQYPGSSGKVTETGIWSIMRSGFPQHQNMTNDTPVWLLFSNLNDTREYQFDCSDNTPGLGTRALVAPFDAGTTVRNLFPPFDSFTLQSSSVTLGLNGSTHSNGCLDSMTMKAYEFRAYVSNSSWRGIQPAITRFTPGHDARILAVAGPGGNESFNITLDFTVGMNCDAITRSITFATSARMATTPDIRNGSVTCEVVTESPELPQYSGILQSAFRWSAELENVEPGIHAMYVNSPADASGTTSTNATDIFLFRVGRQDNPLVFPNTANYSSDLVQSSSTGMLQLSHSAPGAELWRYSTNWGSSYSDWMPYTGSSSNVSILGWSGTQQQSWKEQHVRVEYWNHLVGSADHVVEGDEGAKKLPARRFPHLFVQGPFNEYGYDSGPRNAMTLKDPGTWDFYFLTEWPAILQLNVWGINPDKQPDKTFVLGDYDGDSILDRQPPSALAAAVINITGAPPSDYVGWNLRVDDGTGRFHLTAAGHAKWQLAIFILLWIIPVIFGAAAIWIFRRSFYGVKTEKFGLIQKASRMSVFPLTKKSPNVNEAEVSPPHSPPMQLSKAPNDSWKLPGLVPADAEITEPSRRTVLIATMEYDIEDWEIKIKIGGLGVMAQLMGKNLSHQNLIWVVPKVGDVDYPNDEQAEPMNVKILGKAYKVSVQYHRLRNITYVLLDAPVFRAQSKSDPYPSRMDDLPSAIYYSAWNQCIAQAIERFPIDLYHINDYHGCVAPLYLLPSTIPVCLSLHNAEFQGLWPMRTPQECDEVSKVFNIPSVFVKQFVQFGTVFNLLHAGASYLRVYQQGFGAVGVSKKYGVRSYLRYPIFWGLKKVGQLPNPDPTDTGDWDKQLPREQDIVIDPDFEAKRPSLKREAQEWAGLNVDPEADLFVFVGRWSTQKGIDLIADVFPSVLESHPKAQLVAVGPVIDLYGRFAAAKLDRMMQKYPGRVFSRPEFTSLPPCIFSGSDFALIPSRDEPFGLVAVEFGRKGAICVGARVGGLGQMPGWWYTIESMQTQHLLEQFKSAVNQALESKPAVRATMRARSAKQRFPVKQWVEDLDILQSTAIRNHAKSSPEYAQNAGRRKSEQPRHKVKRRQRFTYHDSGSSHNIPLQSPRLDPFPSETASAVPPVVHEPILADRQVEPEDRYNNQSTAQDALFVPGLREPTLPDILPATPSDSGRSEIRHDTAAGREQMAKDLAMRLQAEPGEYERRDLQSTAHTRKTSRATSGVATPRVGPSEARALSMIRAHQMDQQQIFLSGEDHSAYRPALSKDLVVGARKDYNLQQVDPFFTDPSGEYQRTFEKKLETLSGGNSESRLCIEEYLIKSEKQFFTDFRNKKLGISMREKAHISVASSTTLHANGSTTSIPPVPQIDENNEEDEKNDLSNTWGIPESHVTPRGLRKWMQVRVGDWPIYAFFLILGQVIAANSYQIILLTGQVGQDAQQVYLISSVYAVASILWWVLFRRMGSRACLSLPFFFYGIAFLFVGLGRFASAGTPRSVINNLSSCAYAVGSASGTFFFVLNFGDEGGAQVRSWVYRACIVQGLQQIYVVVLWFWGFHVNRTGADGSPSPVRSFANSPYMTVIGVLLAVGLWGICALLWITLPEYYRQVPGVVPDFYRSILRRKIINWFFVAVLIQNFFLSTQYGRSWSFLFTSTHAPGWSIFILVAFFFIAVWAVAMWGFGVLTKTHTWFLPILAVGLGAPRWVQTWWAVSGMAAWLPWAPGGYVGSALVSRALWLWLGVLDMAQGVGLGMILLSTLTRVHVLFTLVVAQFLGAATTAVARACSPAKLGPGALFPDLTENAVGLKNAWFWIGLLLNLAVCTGFFKFFRKEQLTKP